MSRINLKKLTTHAMPMPNAAHCTHHSPGEVITLMTNSMSTMNGAVIRNFTRRRGPNTIGSLTPSLRSGGGKVSPRLRRGDGERALYRKHSKMQHSQFFSPGGLFMNVRQFSRRRFVGGVAVAAGALSLRPGAEVFAQGQTPQFTGGD